MSKPGNALLEMIFPERLDVINSESYPEGFHPSEASFRRRRLKNSDYGGLTGESDYADLEPVVSPVIGMGEGIHAIAWYVPFHVGGMEGWGIYFDVTAMNRVGIEIATQARKIDREVSNSESLKVIYAAVLRHELEHAIQELLLAKAINDKFFDIRSLSTRNFAVQGSYRETIASHFEHLDNLRRLGSIRERRQRLLRWLWTQQSSPAVYDAWKRKELTDLDNLYEGELGFPSFGNNSSAMRENLDGKVRSKYIDIPVYNWMGNSLNISLDGLDLRAQSVDCKKLKRFLVRDGLARYFDDAIRVSDSTDHDLIVRGAGSGRPIKYGCHDWDNVPNKVLGELSDILGLTRAEFVERLRKYL